MLDANNSNAPLSSTTVVLWRWIETTTPYWTWTETQYTNQAGRFDFTRNEVAWITGTFLLTEGNPSGYTSVGVTYPPDAAEGEALKNRIVYTASTRGAYLDNVFCDVPVGTSPPLTPTYESYFTLGGQHRPDRRAGGWKPRLRERGRPVADRPVGSPRRRAWPLLDTLGRFQSLRLVPRRQGLKPPAEIPKDAEASWDATAARFYDPFTGRFVSADTIVPQPGRDAHPEPGAG